MDLFQNIETDSNESKNRCTGAGTSGSGRGTGSGNKFAGPNGLTDRSQLSQLLDPSGKAYPAGGCD